ncbi:MAG TPA: hypothetical protein VKB02_01710 [Pyrinomonadaceae bacterium]|nr:hypothetical protein [Pyrinomonadaceae bacterium]
MVLIESRAKNFNTSSRFYGKPVGITPKALANFSPGFEHRENPGT